MLKKVSNFDFFLLPSTSPPVPSASTAAAVPTPTRTAPTRHTTRDGRHDGSNGLGCSRFGRGVGVRGVPRRTGEGELLYECRRRWPRVGRAGMREGEPGAAVASGRVCCLLERAPWVRERRRRSPATRDGCERLIRCAAIAGIRGEGVVRALEPARRANASSGHSTTARRRRQHSLPDADWRRKVTLLPSSCAGAFLFSILPDSELTSLQCLPGLTVVVSPLIALMKDQVDALRKLNVPAASMDSSLSMQEMSEVKRQLKEGTLKLLYVAPER